MGCSSNSSGQPSFVDFMTKAITAADALGELTELATAFVGMQRDLADNPMIVQLRKAMANAETLVTKTYNLDFSTTPLPQGQTDKGVILNYLSDPGGNMEQIVQQLTTQFSNWNLILTEDQAHQMATTIAVEVNAQLGAVGSTTGSYAVDANTVAQFGLAYGMFTQNDQGDQALVYAFCADEPMSPSLSRKSTLNKQFRDTRRTMKTRLPQPGSKSL